MASSLCYFDKAGNESGSEVSVRIEWKTHKYILDGERCIVTEVFLHVPGIVITTMV